MNMNTFQQQIFKVSDCINAMKASFSFLHQLGTGKGATRLKLQHLQIAVSVAIKHRILNLLSLKERASPEQREDIFLDTVKDGAVHKRMIFRIRDGRFQLASEIIVVSTNNKRRKLSIPHLE